MTGANSGPDSGTRPRWRWDVALSFAGAQRDYVGQVAAALKTRGVRCFYDADEQVGLWGKSLAEELPVIYGEQAAAVVVFVSAEYADRNWTRLERRAALARAVEERREYVLPARFDDTPLPGLLSDMVTIDLRDRTPQEFAALIAGKLAALGITMSAPSADAGDPARDVESTRPAGAERVAEENPQRLNMHKAISGPSLGEKTPRALRLRRADRPFWRRLTVIAGVASIAVVGLVIAITVTPGPPSSSTPGTRIPSTPGTARPAAASNRGNYSNCSVRHCYSIAISPGSMSGRPYQGARATMTLADIRSGRASHSNAAHINSSLWVIQNSAHDAFIEEGIYDGWVGANNTRICAAAIPNRHCIHFIYEPGNGGSSTCINNGCDAYIIYWADTNLSEATENTYFHVVEFTSPSPEATLSVDDGYNFGKWIVHIMRSGLDYYGISTINSSYRYVERVEVGGELDQVAKAGACASTVQMEFGVWVPRNNYNNYIPFDAQASSKTAYVDILTFNGTQQIPGTHPGTWSWNVPTASNANGC